MSILCKICSKLLDQYDNCTLDGYTGTTARVRGSMIIRAASACLACINKLSSNFRHHRPQTNTRHDKPLTCTQQTRRTLDKVSIKDNKPQKCHIKSYFYDVKGLSSLVFVCLGSVMAPIFQFENSMEKETKYKTKMIFNFLTRIIRLTKCFKNSL